MCKRDLQNKPLREEREHASSLLSYLSTFDMLIERIKLLAYGVDTLVLNVRYADRDFEPIQKELDASLVQELDYLQGEARLAETAVASDWTFRNVPLFVEPHGAGRQWRWLLNCGRLFSLVVSRGRFNDVIAQVRFSSEYLWSQQWYGDALIKVHEFLMSLFGEHIHLQVSMLDLCADMMGYDFSLSNYKQHFVTRARKQAVIYGLDEVNLDGHEVSYLRFSSSAAPISFRLYNKTREIEQKSKKTWMYDAWRRGAPGPYGGTWDGSSEVWRLECHLTREFFRNLKSPINDPYDVYECFSSLWSYVVGQLEGGEDASADGWLRYVVPTQDSNRSRWPLHPAWVVAQSAFREPLDPDLGPVVRKRVREVNLERGLAAMTGYSSTLAAFLSGEYATPDADMSLTLQWLYEQGQNYLAEKGRDFFEEIRKKQQRFGLDESAG
jgi:hypothetical protein